MTMGGGINNEVKIEFEMVASEVRTLLEIVWNKVRILKWRKIRRRFKVKITRIRSSAI